ncbi:probable YJU3 Serine protease, localizes to lipid particles [Rhynchosporium secalis]|uniref:Probable YJU3 Serine protease, localizes to lipid particles n=1 Tax=Rhynchosporium secalis TaxID=38038 RepID=A0A1E1MJS2_RHYSE|nr:probable YJU3 Serine protease, localizes to lipid particles [Rhynchosporium secalis]
MPTEVEGTHLVGDVSLYTKTWKPDVAPLAKLVFIHGFNDHCNRYYELFPTLASRGIEVSSFDQRGWGQSVKRPADQGLTGPTNQVIADIASFIKSQLPCSVPLFVMGHSMGGGEALMLASDPQCADLVRDIRGWLLESPFIGFPRGFAPMWPVVFAGRLAGRLLPHKQRFSALPAVNLTRDQDVVKSLEEDKLLHGNGTLEGLAGMLDRTTSLNQAKAQLNPNVRSLWLAHGTEDKGTSYDESKKWFERQTGLEDKEFKTYDGWSHQLHADLPENRTVFASDVADWILARVGGDVRNSKL